MKQLLVALAVAIGTISGASCAGDPATCSTTDGVKTCKAKSEYIAVEACGTKKTSCEITDNGDYWTCTCGSASGRLRPDDLKSNVDSGIRFSSNSNPVRYKN